MDMERENNRDTLRWIREVTRKHHRHVLLLLVVQTLLGFVVLGYAFFLRGMVDSAVSGNRQRLILYALLLIGNVTIQLLLGAAKRYLQEYTASGVENILKERLFCQLLYKDYAAVTATHSGEWINRLSSDTKVVADGVTQILPGLGEMTARLVGALGALLILQPRFALVMLPLLLTALAFTFSLRRKLKELHKKIQHTDGELRVFYQEQLNSMTVIRSYSREKNSAQEAKSAMIRHRDARMTRNRAANAARTAYAATMNGMYIAGAIYCAEGILHGTISVGTFTAILQLVSQLTAPFSNLSGYLPQYYSMLGSTERLREAEDLPDEQLPSDKTDIDFAAFGLSHADFVYEKTAEGTEDNEGRQTVLRNFSFSVSRGEYLAMTGPSGCGKSTVLRILMSLYPLQSGEAFWRDSDGNKRPLDASTRSLFAYVPQGNQLMRGSIRQVITFAHRTDAGDEKIWNALRIACADEFVSQLDQGLDTVLGERGNGLSEGQMQRIAIARAVYSDRPVLLLDEATSSLDEKTEAAFLRNLRTLTDQTVIIITHRPAALGIVDRILQFSEDGTVTQKEKPQIIYEEESK